MFKKCFLLLPFICFLVSGCTISLIATNNHGKATDVVDTNQDQDVSPDIRPDIKIPATI